MVANIVTSALRSMPTTLRCFLLGRSTNLYACRFKSYEHDGKTTVKLLNTDPESGILIDSISQVGFRLNNGMTVLGPMVIFPKTVLSWNVSGINDVNEESLSLFCHLEPKIDILVIGVGDYHANVNFSKEVLKFMRKYNVNVEILATEQACSTYNFLNVERRSVAGAFIPPEKLQVLDDDVVQTKARKNSIYIS